MVRPSKSSNVVFLKMVLKSRKYITRCNYRIDTPSTTQLSSRGWGVNSIVSSCNARIISNFNLGWGEGWWEGLFFKRRRGFYRPFSKKRHLTIWTDRPSWTIWTDVVYGCSLMTISICSDIKKNIRYRLLYIIHPHAVKFFARLF